MLFRAEVVDARGLVVEQVLVPVEATLPRQPAAAAEIGLAELEAAAEGAARAMVPTIAGCALPRLEAEIAREEALTASDDSVPMAAIQTGLFERRALREAEAERRKRASLQDAARQRVEDLRRASRIDLAGRPRPVLVAFLRGA